MDIESEPGVSDRGLAGEKLKNSQTISSTFHAITHTIRVHCSD